MVTIQEVFDTAIHLMDAQNESSGATETQDTAPYKVRTISILNATIPHLYPFSDTYQSSDPGTRPVCPRLVVSDYRTPDFTQSIPLDDSLAIGVLPYALASQLLAGENEELSSYFQNQYMQQFSILKDKILGVWEKIPLPYGTF